MVRSSVFWGFFAFNPLFTHRFSVWCFHSSQSTLLFILHFIDIIFVLLINSIFVFVINIYVIYVFLLRAVYVLTQTSSAMSYVSNSFLFYFISLLHLFPFFYNLCMVSLSLYIHFHPDFYGVELTNAIPWRKL